MANNVGKNYWYMSCVKLLSLLLLTTNILGYVELKVLSLEGNSLQKAGVGRPIVVEVAIAGHDTIQEPQVHGLEQGVIQGTEKHIAILQGQTTIKYRFKVRFDVPGKYILGPADVIIAGSLKQSNTVTLIVADEQQTDRQDQQEEAWLKLECNKSRVVVGEKIVTTITFYGMKDLVNVEGIREPVIDGTVGAKKGPGLRDETIKGKLYKVIEYQVELFPTKPGRFVVPAYNALINVQRSAHGQLAAFSPFFQFLTEARTIYSNACVIDVDPLPEADGSVQAVGCFKEYSATLKPSTAKVGEGMVLTLAIEGEGNDKTIETPSLQKMPEALRWYESKRYVRDAAGAHNLPVLCFEYIVQGLVQGDWEVPSQQFIYFDTGKRTIKTLTTAPVQVSIHPGSLATTMQQPKMNGAGVVLQPNDVPEAMAMTIITKGNWYGNEKAFVLPWWLFFVIFVLPLFLLVKPLSQRYASWYLPLLTYKGAFFRARSNLKKARALNDTTLLLPLFLELCAIRFEMPRATITAELIEHELRQRGMSMDKIRSWNSFIVVLEEETFGKNGKTHSKITLFDQAQVWIAELESLL